MGTGYRWGQIKAAKGTGTFALSNNCEKAAAVAAAFFIPDWVEILKYIGIGTWLLGRIIKIVNNRRLRD